ncbi:hypothetical protein KIW84_046145 [Lathyrus oleraceus]|uniref:Retrovirus-related Pol polyprotein from transposon TNT 1-94-like beta-barrel domain-containing protein n=1 Tax=Pisum sativum TaxID=3888 RepID=A0A9D4XQ61_PEA|nr:hypothetical protein KIW84_046145 [Pisum sativum]
MRREANYVEFDDSEELLLMTLAEVEGDGHKGVWFLDSGCSNHMTGNKGWFCEINESFRHTVKLGNNSKLAVMGKGNIRFEVEGMTQLISDVCFVPELSSNLLSIGQLQEKGVDIRIKGGMCKVYHPQRGLIMNTRMTVNGLFIVFAFRKPLSSKCMKEEQLRENTKKRWRLTAKNNKKNNLQQLSQILKILMDQILIQKFLKEETEEDPRGCMTMRVEQNFRKKK